MLIQLSSSEYVIRTEMCITLYCTIYVNKAAIDINRGNMIDKHCMCPIIHTY
jgi:hypothetical protein